jgi:hypothetical protein
MAPNRKKSAAQRRHEGREAAESSRKLRRQQKQAQDVAERAGQQLAESQKHQSSHMAFLSETTGQFANPFDALHAASIRFLNTEAEVGLNLARIAAESHDPSKTERNRRRAREAYDTILKFLGPAVPTSEELQSVQEKLSTLRELLSSLGERL